TSRAPSAPIACAAVAAAATFPHRACTTIASRPNSDPRRYARLPATCSRAPSTCGKSAAISSCIAAMMAIGMVGSGGVGGVGNVEVSRCGGEQVRIVPVPRGTGFPARALPLLPPLPLLPLPSPLPLGEDWGEGYMASLPVFLHGFPTPPLQTLRPRSPR